MYTNDNNYNCTNCTLIRLTKYIINITKYFRIHITDTIIISKYVQIKPKAIFKRAGDNANSI